VRDSLYANDELTFAPASHARVFPVQSDNEFLESLSYASESWFALEGPSFCKPLPFSTAFIVSPCSAAPPPDVTQNAQAALDGANTFRTSPSSNLNRKRQLSGKRPLAALNPDAPPTDPVIPSKYPRSVSTSSHDSAVFTIKGREQPISPISDEKKRQPSVARAPGEAARTSGNWKKKFFDSSSSSSTKSSDEDAAASTSEDDEEEEDVTSQGTYDDVSTESRRAHGRNRKKGTSKSKASSSGKRRASSAGQLVGPFTSSFRGVSCCGKDRKFQARIRDGCKVHYLGRFDNEFDAAIKYDEAARQHKGDLAMPNFVEMTPTQKADLEADYFANNRTFSVKFHPFLMPGTLERLELARTIAANKAQQLRSKTAAR